MGSRRPLEVSGIDFYLFDDPAMRQSDDDPVVTGFASSPGFPTVTHIDPPPRRQKITDVPVMLVIAG